MQAVLQFKLPEERDEYETMLKANALFSIIEEMDKFLRSKMKRGDDLSEPAKEAYDTTRQQLFLLQKEYQVLDLFGWM